MPEETNRYKKVTMERNIFFNATKVRFYHEEFLTTELKSVFFKSLKELNFLLCDTL
jgi:hypothetical protein